MLRLLGLPIAMLLAVFNLRRLLFLLAALKRDAARPLLSALAGQPGGFVHHPSVLILVACRDEAAALPGLIDSLARLDYPAQRLRVALIDDGSTDQTRALIDLAAENHAGWWAIHMDGSHGKAAALNAALAQIAFGDVIVVYDADHRPEPESLRRLVAALDDPVIAGASGRTIPINPTASLPAYYATVESIVHQMITMRAKDRLDLAPALLGSNCAYRRTALAQAGGFRPGALLEDSDLTLTFARLGYRLRFAPEAIAWHRAPETIDGYLRQHARWARGFDDVAREHAAALLADAKLPLRLRIELALFALGYLDRLALLAGASLRILRHSVAQRIPSGAARFFAAQSKDAKLAPDPKDTRGDALDWALRASLLMPLAQIVAAFVVERAPRGMWLRLPAIPFMFGLDVLATASAAIESILNRPRVWAKTERE
jgi:cellulose synthase/poly-beta-1,6-N-acetylglucosamine synthase-like glycosyltransferase